MPVPVFYSNDEYSIAIQVAEGDSGIPKAFNSLLNLEFEQLAGVAVLCDADQKAAQQTFDNLLVKLKEEVDEDYHALFKNAVFGELTNETPSFGVYVFPDNVNTGTLENLLLEGGEIAYPDLIANAQIYVESIPETYRRRNWTISSSQKVLFGVMANALRPGKANQVSIQDNKWISDLTVTSISQNKLRDFITDLLK